MALLLRIRRFVGIVLFLVLFPAVGSAQTFAVVFEGHLSGASVVPPTMSTAFGYCTMSLNAPETSVYMGIRFTGLSGPNTAVHVHGPADSGSTGPIVYDIPITGSTTVIGTSLQSISPSQVASLKQGLWYIDVHSAAFPSGEVRAQFRVAAPVIGAMDATQVVPPSGATASGVAKLGLDPLSSPTGMMFMISYAGLTASPTGVHIHGPALPGENGPIVFSVGGMLAPTSQFIAFTTVSPTQVAQLQAGQWYFDFHTTTHPDGEIRGQIRFPDKTTEFDGDSRAEIGVFRESSGTWYLQNPGTGAFTGIQFGQAGDLLTPADFDGDGKTDRAVWRSGTFYAWLSGTNALRVQPFGTIGDDPRVCGDYDGDGKADFAVWRQPVSPGGPSFLYILQSLDGTLRTVQWGTADDVTQIGDYDGDHKRDPVVYRPATGTYYVLQSTAGFRAQPWGVFKTDYLTPGDYDADGKTDFAVWRFGGPTAGTWYILRSSTGTLQAELFGLPTDLPVPGDFDGDGKYDVAVVRLSGGSIVWYALRSSTGTLLAQPFGLDSDLAIHFYLIR